MLVDGRSKFLERAARVIADDRKEGKKVQRDRFPNFSEQELRIAQLKSITIR
mgnify:FL=1